MEINFFIYRHSTSYSLFEHSFGIRAGGDDDEEEAAAGSKGTKIERAWMALSPLMAPVKVCLVPQMNNNPTV
jgi:hypothetical protein